MTLVAQVGAFKRMSTNDSIRWMTALRWMADKEIDLPRGVTHDAVNLKYKRDFLAEDKKYDIVVLHSIFDGHNLTAVNVGALKGVPKAVRAKMRIAVGQSPMHSEAAWSARLADSGARYIFVFEDMPASLNGWGLGDLPGYITAHRDTLFTAYVKS